MAAPPNLSVAFAFGVNPGTVPTSGQWVDVTAYVDSLSTSSGRDDEFSEPGAGTCTLVMSNATGRFDPVYASGPYYGQLKPMVPVRVMGGVSSADTAVFYGWVSIDGFRVSPRPPADSVVEVTVVDAVELLAHADLSGYLLNYERGLDSPAHLWRFDGSAQDSIVANNPATLHPEASFTGPSLVDSAPGPALAMPWDIYDPSTLEVEFFGAVAPAGASGTAFTVELMFQSDPSTRSGQPTVEVLRMTGTTGSYVQVLLGGEFDPSFGLPFGFYVAGSGSGYTTSAAAHCDGNPHHVAVTRNGTTFKVYIDGVLLYTAVVAGVVLDGIVNVAHALNNTPSPGDPEPAVQYVSDLAVWSSDIGAARILLHAQAALGTAYAGETTGARIGRVLTMAGWPSTLRVIEPGTSHMPALVTAGRDAWSVMTEAAKAEDGRLWIDHAAGGAPRFTGRYAAENAGTHLLTTDERGAEAGIGRWVNGANTTVAQSATQARTGTKSLRIVSTSATWEAVLPAQNAGYPAPPSGVYNGFPVVPGREYRFGGYARSGAGTIGTAVTLRFVNAAGALLGPYLTPFGGITATATAWTAFTGTYNPDNSNAWVVAPPTATVGFLQVTGTASGQTLYLDDLYLIEGPVDDQQRNRLTTDERTFEAGIGRWSGANSGTTLAVTAAQAHSGTKSMAITATALVGGFWWANLPAQPATFPATPWNGFTVTPGREYSVGLWARSATIARNIGMGFAFLAADGTALSFLPADVTVSSVTTAWTQGQSAVVVAPAGAVSAWLYIYGTSAGGEVTYVDDVYVLEGGGRLPTLIVLGDDGTAATAECIYEDPELDDGLIVNYAVTSRRDGPEFVAQNTSSIASYLKRPMSDTGLELRDDADAKARGERLVASHSSRRRRVKQLTLRPSALTHPAWTQVFARKIGDRIQFKNRPRYGGTTIADGVIEAVAHGYDPVGGWSTRLVLSPLESGVGTWDYGTWDTSKWGY